MSTSPFTNSSSSPADLLAELNAQYAKRAAQLLGSTATSSSPAQPDDDIDALYAGLTEAEIRFIERLNAPVNEAPNAPFNKSNFMPGAAQKGQPACPDEVGTAPEQPSTNKAEVGRSAKPLGIHPYLGDCLTMIADRYDMDFDDLASLFVRCALQSPKKSLKKPFPGYGDPIIHCYDYEHIPASLKQELSALSLSTGLVAGNLINRVLHYSLLRYYAGKLHIPTGNATD